jgi:ubiquinol-cytochrome c reductase cytochrome c1 subunit
MKKLLTALLLAPLLAFAAGVELHLDKAPNRANDTPALQRGAQIFVSYCLNCHSASYMRYNRLKDIGFTEEQIKSSLMFAAEKTGEPMTIGMRRNDAKQWFGAPPPDLTLIARSRASGDGSGSDWLYTYLRGFYRDDARPTGWNNTIFPNVGMPHVLWEYQGDQVMGEDKKIQLAKPGKMSKAEYDNMVGDLVGFLQYMGEPAAEFRKKLGVMVLIALSIIFVFAYALKREYWKDIH